MERELQLPIFDFEAAGSRPFADTLLPTRIPRRDRLCIHGVGSLVPPRNGAGHGRSGRAPTTGRAVDGVTITISSVLDLFCERLLKSSPNMGICARPGT